MQPDLPYCARKRGGGKPLKTWAWRTRALHEIFIVYSSFARSRPVDCPRDFKASDAFTSAILWEKNMRGKWTLAGIGATGLGLVWLAAVGCNSPSSQVGKGGAQESTLKGDIKIDGSSTVYLITEAVASNFKKQHPD